jgi:hypothetical protein
VRRFIGCGVGFARLVDTGRVSVLGVVDMARRLAANAQAQKREWLMSK